MLKVAYVTTISGLITVLALLGFSYSQYFVFLCILAIPLGLGAGCAEATNNYVALHHKANHMNRLHFFWGVVATLMTKRKDAARHGLSQDNPAPDRHINFL